MPTLVTEQGIVHYETLGRGRPVLLLHGWLGSWALWRDTIAILSKEFKVYALDFFGFGESLDRTANFSVPNYVALVDQFMERMGIDKAAVVGHSMGGTVSLSLSSRQPQKVVKVTVIGSPIEGKSLNWLLKLSGYRGVARVFWTSPALMRLFMRGYAYRIARDGARVGTMIANDITKVSSESFFMSIGTLRETDLRPDIGALPMAVMGIYGKYDRIVDPRQHQVLHQLVPQARIEYFDGSGHFPMMDEPDRFHDALRDFLHNG